MKIESPPLVVQEEHDSNSAETGNETTVDIDALTFPQQEDTMISDTEHANKENTPIDSSLTEHDNTTTTACVAHNML
jgi:hypothetical protein